MLSHYFSVSEDKLNLCASSKALDGGDSYEAEALVQVFIRGASFEQSEGNEVKFPL